MKLFDFYATEDFGWEYYLNILQIKRFCLLQFNFDMDEYAGSSGFIMNIGHSSLFGFSIQIWKVGFTFDFLSWFCRNLDDYRRWGNETTT